jgi:hypothetical protein
VVPLPENTKTIRSASYWFCFSEVDGSCDGFYNVSIIREELKS